MKTQGLVGAYDTLTVEEVEKVIGYYLQHRDEVRAYIEAKVFMCSPGRLCGGIGSPGGSEHGVWRL